MSSELQDQWTQLKQDIKRWGIELGFQQVGIANINLEKHKIALQDWLDKGYHGEMSFMSKNQDKRQLQMLHLENLVADGFVRRIR